MINAHHANSVVIAERLNTTFLQRLRRSDCRFSPARLFERGAQPSGQRYLYLKSRSPACWSNRIGPEVDWRLAPAARVGFFVNLPAVKRRVSLGPRGGNGLSWPWQPTEWPQENDDDEENRQYQNDQPCWREGSIYRQVMLSNRQSYASIIKPKPRLLRTPQRHSHWQFPITYLPKAAYASGSSIAVHGCQAALRIIVL